MNGNWSICTQSNDVCLAKILVEVRHRPLCIYTLFLPNKAHSQYKHLLTGLNIHSMLAHPDTKLSTPHEHGCICAPRFLHNCTLFTKHQNSELK